MTCSDIGRPGFDRRMSRDEINACPMECWTGPVSVVRTRDELAVAMRKLAGHTLLGFDTETRKESVHVFHTVAEFNKGVTTRSLTTLTLIN